MSAEDVKVENISFPSHDGTSTIHAVIWSDPTISQPVGIMQIAHGMAEYIERYDTFARDMANRGFIVCGNDHIGHGRSVATQADWGFLPVNDGKTVLVEDVHTLRGLMEERYGTDIPYVLLGHSMGSFVARLYIARHGAGLAAAIIQGTGYQPGIVARMGAFLAKRDAKIHGDHNLNDVLRGMAEGSYSSAIKDARTPLDWLSKDEAVVDAYIADPACGFAFTSGGYTTLMDMLAAIVKPAIVDRIPKDLPILLVSGSEDPVGDDGKGVEKVYQQLQKAGIQDVTMKLFEGMRHEIHNEADKQMVFDYIYDWMKERIL